jgi:ribosomal protein L31
MNETNSNSDWSDRELGALWRKGGDKPFYSGSLTVSGSKTEIVIFKNKFKENDSQPDLRIYLSKPQGSESDSSNDWSEREIGALWRKGGDKPFYSGSLSVKDQKTEVVIFKNKFKEKDAQPDLRIYKSKELQK